MDITQYTGYFHDGSLLKIDARNSHIILSLESAEIDPMEFGNIKILSKSNTLLKGGQRKGTQGIFESFSF
ncbi:MAG: hypothetical protein P0S93_05950 [Candidatus Neptunochlamydia sp.]|nr:hypothetical protein [Candidatus Neptunochlamydia sp.]